MAVLPVLVAALCGIVASLPPTNVPGDDIDVVRNSFTQDEVPLVRLTRDILSRERYDIRVRPVLNHTETLRIHISMSLYQIIDVNEPSQNIKMNVWMIQKWEDQMLDWDPHEYNMINTTILPHTTLWIPDTTLYNSVVMNPEETERYMNIRADTLYWEGRKGSKLSFLYPAIYTVTCRLNIRYFPYDQQNCTLTISSWTNSKSALDYTADPEVNMASYIPNEEWDVISFKIFRHEYKYACCPEPWVILEASIVIRRKPLYYVVNLIIPTSIITLVSITGFFTPASTADDRTEKINLGITTLLAMSILMLMVSDQMPTTSEFVPLIAWFYLSIIIIISIGTFLTSVILSIQGRRQYGKMPPPFLRLLFFTRVCSWVCLAVPPQLSMLWDELNDHPQDVYVNQRKAKREGSKKAGKGAKVTGTREKPASPLNHHTVLEEVPEKAAWRDGAVDSHQQNNNVPSRPASTNQESPRAKSNWLRVGKAASQYRNRIDVPMIDISAPHSPISPNMMRSRHGSIWENAVTVMGVTTPRIQSREASVKGMPGVAGVSSDVLNMKQKRQCSLEWEFLATILDRIFLVIFTMTVVIVTVGIIVTGRVAQLAYDDIEEDLSAAN